MKSFTIFYGIGAAYAVVCHLVAPANRTITIVRFVLWFVHLPGFLLWKIAPHFAAPISCDEAGHYQTGADGNYWCARCKLRRSKKPIKGRYQWFA